MIAKLCTCFINFTTRKFLSVTTTTEFSLPAIATNLPEGSTSSEVAPLNLLVISFDLTTFATPLFNDTLIRTMPVPLVNVAAIMTLSWSMNLILDMVQLESKSVFRTMKFPVTTDITSNVEAVI